MCIRDRVDVARLQDVVSRAVADQLGHVAERVDDRLGEGYRSGIITEERLEDALRRILGDCS